jgi:hypothetical protein
MPPLAQLRPGYLVVRSNDGTYVGGLMVTDDNGMPLDFRYTDPISPTRLQRALYGGALDRYLRADVVAVALFNAVQEKPTVVLVEDEGLLEDASFGCPVAMVTSSRLPPLGAAGATRSDGSTMLVQTDEAAGPLRVVVADEKTGTEISEGLVRLGGRIDPLEPAQRVHTALDLIASGETV